MRSTNESVGLKLASVQDEMSVQRRKEEDATLKAGEIVRAGAEIASRMREEARIQLREAEERFRHVREKHQSLITAALQNIENVQRANAEGMERAEKAARTIEEEASAALEEARSSALHKTGAWR
eukprot:456326-Rhodomonas_salina.1